MKKKLSLISITMISASVGFVTFLGIMIAHGAWQDPSGTPPQNNVAAPLNVSVVPQVKSGGLALNAGGAGIGLYVNKDVQIADGNLRVLDQNIFVETGNLRVFSGDVILGGGYLKLPLITSSTQQPPTTDCSQTSHVGRVRFAAFGPTGARTWVCIVAGGGSSFYWVNSDDSPVRKICRAVRMTTSIIIGEIIDSVEVPQDWTNEDCRQYVLNAVPMQTGGVYGSKGYQLGCIGFQTPKYSFGPGKFISQTAQAPLPNCDW